MPSVRTLWALGLVGRGQHAEAPPSGRGCSGAWLRAERGLSFIESGLVDLESLELKERVSQISERVDLLKSVLSTGREQARIIEQEILPLATPASAPLFGDGLLLEVFMPGELAPRKTSLLSEAMWTVQFPNSDVAEPKCAVSLAMNNAVLGRLHLSTVSQYSYKIGGSLYFAESGRYFFRLSKLTGDLRVSVNGQNVMQNWVGIEAPDQMARGGVDTDHFDVDVDSGPTQVLFLSQGLYSTTLFDLCVFREKPSSMRGEEDPLTLTTAQLYATDEENVCGSMPNTFDAGCSHTFDDVLRLRDTGHVACRASCVRSGASVAPQNPVLLQNEAFGSSEKCYRSTLRACESMVEAGFIGAKGGVVGAHRHGENLVCLEGAESRGFPWKLKSVVALPNAEETESFLTENPHFSALLTNQPVVLALEHSNTAQGVTEARLSCGSATADELKLRDNLALSLTVGTSAPFVTHLYLAGSVREAGTLHLRSGVPDLSVSPINGWSRQTCGQSSLLSRTVQSSEEMPHVSAVAHCATTFKDLYASPLFAVQQPSLVVLCLDPNCTDTPVNVRGLHTYTEDSSVCLASQHAGVIGRRGGYVQVIPSASGLSLALSSSKRYNVTATSVGSEDAKTRAYHVDLPRGELCAYPEKTRIKRTAVDTRALLPNGGSLDPAPLAKTIELTPNFLQSTGLFGTSNDTWTELVGIQDSANSLTEESAELESDLEKIRADIGAQTNALAQSLTDLTMQLMQEPALPSITLVADLLSRTTAASTLSEIGLVWDASQVDAGPSLWSIGEVDGVFGIAQHSAIVSQEPAAYGTTLVMISPPYSDSFFETTLSSRFVGKVAVLFHYLNPSYYQAVEIVRTNDKTVDLRIVERAGAKGVTTLLNKAACAVPATGSTLGIRFSSEAVYAKFGAECTGSVRSIGSPFLTELKKRGLPAQGNFALATDALSRPVVFANVRFGPQTSLIAYADDFVKLDEPDALVPELVSVVEHTPQSESVSFAKPPERGEPEFCVTAAVISTTLDEKWLEVPPEKSVQEAWSARDNTIFAMRHQTDPTTDPGIGVLLYAEPACATDECLRLEGSLRTDGAAGLVYDIVDELNMRAVFVKDATTAQAIEVKDGIGRVLEESTVLRRAPAGAWHNATVLLCEAEQQIWLDGLPVVKESVRRLSPGSRRFGLGIARGSTAWRYLRLSRTN